MKIGVLGGSFDPNHNGHLVAAQHVANQLGLQQVLFVPAGNQWQKTQLAGVEQTDSKHRLAMTRLAIAGNPLFSANSIDVDWGGATYTVDTLTELQQAHPNAKLFFILGADAIAGVESWKDSEKLFDLATFVAVSRPGFQLQVPERFKDRVIQIRMESLDLSSTECRERALAGQELTGMVPDAVITYIRENNLYQEAK